MIGFVHTRIDYENNLFEINYFIMKGLQNKQN